MRKEFLHIVRDTRTLLITFALPIVMLILYGYALTFDIKNIPTVVRDMDNKPMTREIVRKFEASRYFNVIACVDSYKDAEKYFLSGKANLIINFDNGFSGRVLSGKKAQVQVILDGADANTATVSIGYINGILQDYTKSILITSLSRSGMKDAQSLIPIDAKTRVWYNESLRSMNFLVPGIISMVLMILAALITSLSIVSEKTRGTMEQLIATSIRPVEIMTGKLLPYVLIGFLDVLLCVSFGAVVFKVPIRGDLLFLFIESAIFIFGSLGLGLLISTISDKQENAVIIGMMTTMLPSILLSGFVFPIEGMPYMVQLITYLVPARYFLTILRGIFMKGIGIEYLWPDTLMLVIFGCIMIALSAKRFRKRLD
ncbi:MAG: ABC transporter permease [Candidatus Saganbacteria bacterium]|nr:ABC transporter permease [Candidatus Saganbacteria bacterium]